MQSEPKSDSPRIANLSDYVKIGKQTKIWQNCNIYGTAKLQVTIGNNSQIGSYSEIKPGVKIGHHCRIQAFLFASEGTQIGNYVFIGPRVTILNDKYPSAINAIKGKWKFFPVKIENSAVIGGGAVIGPGVSIGRRAFVGMGAVVTKNVKPGEIVVGNPARVIGKITDRLYMKKLRIRND